MSYLVLARKYRPRTFAEVVGQDDVTRVLQGAIAEERVGHAYLLTGPRGTGKTTSARLFAKALNCEHGPAVEPCGSCERCLSLDAGSEADVLEIDAASNTGVDHVRDLRDQASYVPLRARFKIFIIDEVHMLSKAAFNALLKTLEEPPPHVKFIFATTELHKVPDTIQSRCQVLRLSPLPESTIAKRLDEVLTLEGVTVGEGVCQELARRARGGMRDALSLADQLLALVGSSPTLADCERISGTSSADAVDKVVECLLAQDPPGLMAALPQVAGGESELLSGLLDHLRACLLAALCGEASPQLAGSGADPARLVERGKRIGARRLELWLQELLHARERVRQLPSHARLVLEVTLLDLCHPESSLGLDELATRLGALEERLATGVPGPPPANRPPPPSVPRDSGAAASGPASPVELKPEPPPSSGPSPESAPESAPESSSGPSSPGTVDPGTVDPGTVDPGTVDPGTVDPGTVDPGPARTSRPAAPASSTTSRSRVSSAAEAWDAFLVELERQSSGLHAVISRRGRLEQYRAGRATIKLVDLGQDERPLVEEPRNLRTCSKAFSAAVGQAVEVVLEDLGTERPGARDPFTQEVANLFDGRIEDQG